MVKLVIENGRNKIKIYKKITRFIRKLKTKLCILLGSWIHCHKTIFENQFRFGDTVLSEICRLIFRYQYTKTFYLKYIRQTNDSASQNDITSMSVMSGSHLGTVKIARLGVSNLDIILIRWSLILSVTNDKNSFEITSTVKLFKYIIMLILQIIKPNLLYL